MKRILLVDDSPTVIEVAYDELEEEGYLVDVAYNGKKAIKFLHECGDDLPDLVVMDIEMPVMRGDEAVAIIKTNPPWEKLPIVALTSKAPETLGENLAYFDNYLIKPFGFNELKEMVHRIIGPPD